MIKFMTTKTKDVLTTIEQTDFAGLGSTRGQDSLETGIAVSQLVPSPLLGFDALLADELPSSANRISERGGVVAKRMLTDRDFQKSAGTLLLPRHQNRGRDRCCSCCSSACVRQPGRWTLSLGQRWGCSDATGGWWPHRGQWEEE